MQISSLSSTNGGLFNKSIGPDLGGRRIWDDLLYFWVA